MIVPTAPSSVVESSRRAVPFSRPTTVERIASWLWFGPYRRLGRAVLQRLLNLSTRVWVGPLRGIVVRQQGEARLGIYELNVQRALCDIVRPGDWIYDIGSFQGLFSLLSAMRVGPTGKVVVFEPLPQNRDATIATVRDNGLDERLIMVPFACSDREETLTLYFGANTSEASILRLGARDSVSVPAISLDAFVAGKRIPDVVKMDVEGAEEKVLRGATQLLAAPNAPAWIIEVHSEPLEQAITALLAQHDYSIRWLETWHPNPKQYPRHVFAAKR